MYRSGGPKVPSSNLGSPTDKPQLFAFELVVVAVWVVGAFVVVVFVDENTVAVGETLLAVLAAATPKGEQEKQPGG